MIIAPSLLAADFGNLAKEAKRAGRSGADWLHLDIMDGHFVQNISFGPQVVRTLRPLTRMFFDVHLMCSQPEVLLESFAEAGAQQINVHVELGEKVLPLLWKIKSLGIKVGLAVNPPTPIAQAQPFFDRIDTLLVMTVNPGLGGQAFIHETLPKIQQAAELKRERNLAFQITVDGGVDCKTAPECALAGADVFVSGTALFGSRHLASAVRRMRKAIQKAVPQSTSPPIRESPVA